MLILTIITLVIGIFCFALMQALEGAELE